VYNERPPTRIPRGPHNTAVVAPAPLRSFRRPHARLYHVVRRVTRNFMHFVELDSYFNNLINMLINMLKSKNGVSVAKDFFTHRPARPQEFIQDASIYLPGAREHFLALRTVSTALSILLFATSCTLAICHHSC